MLKEKVIQELKRLVEALGTSAAVARKANVSEATISQIISGTYKAAGYDMYHKIANVLGLQVENTWQVLATRNFQIITQVLEDSQYQSHFRIVSEKAGSGKTTTAKYYANQNASNVFFIQAREWSRSRFMEALMRAIGLSQTNNLDTFVDKVSSYLNMKQKPLIIIDEADKLKPAALRLLIPLYNECEGRLGITLLGTDNLEKELRRGVKYDLKGYDELFSRFGRTCVHLIGEDEKSVANICRANGIIDPSVCKQIFKSCQTESVNVGSTFQMVIKDLRQLKSKIQGELLKKEDVKEAQAA